MGKSPRVSVIVFIGDQRWRAQLCLQSILQQSRIGDAEVLVFDCGSLPHPPLPGAGHPQVKMMACPQPPLSGHVQAQAVRLASAPIVAFLEEHVHVDADWLDAVIHAHADKAAAIGGVVINGNPGQGMSDAVYLINYSDFLPNSALREDIKMLKAHNCTYKRDYLLRYGDRLSLLLLNEPMLHWQLLQDGCTIQLNPGIKIYHRNETRLRDIAYGYFLWNLNFGHSRPLIQAWRLWKRGLYILASPLIPWVRIYKMDKALKRQRARKFMPVFHSYLPRIMILLCISVLGQTLGLLFGSLGAERAFLDYEINSYRGSPPA